MTDMTSGPPVHNPLLDRPRRTAEKLCGLAVVLSAAGVVAWTGDLLTRPPCPPNYVRLIDFELAAPVVTGLLLLLSLFMLARARGSGPPRVLLGTATLVVALTGYLLYGSVLAIEAHQAPYDLGCWTF
jgi:hypothetical protein